jgi:hypothetical protein
MRDSLSNGFYAKLIDCNVYYDESYFDYEVSKLVDIKEELKYFTDVNNYIRCFIEHLKNNVIKKLPNLNSVKIELKIFDRDNMLHRFMIVISNMIQDLLKFKQKINLCKSIIVSVEYETKIIFIGNINFTGID